MMCAANNSPPTPPPAPGPASTAGAPPTNGSAMLTPLDPVRVLRQYRLLLAVSGVIGLVIAVAATAVLARLAPRYEAFTQLEVRGNLAGPDSLDVDGQISEDALEREMRTQVNYIRANKTLRAAVQLPNVKSTKWYQRIERRAGQSNRPTVDAAIDELNGALKVGAITRSKLIEVRVSARHRDDAPILAMAVTQAYLDDMALLTNRSGNELESAFMVRRDDAELQATRLEAQMQDLLDREGLASADRQLNADQIRFDDQVRRMHELKQEFSTAQHILQATENAMAQGTMERSAEDISRAEAHPAIASRMQAISLWKEQKSALLSRFGPDHHAIRRIDDNIAAAEVEQRHEMNRVLGQMDELRLSQARGYMAETQAAWEEAVESYRELEVKMQSLAALLEDYAALKQRRQNQRDEIAHLDTLLDDMKIMRRRPDALRVHMSHQANIPNRRAFPRYETMVPAITLLMLLFVGGLVFARELLDQRIKSPSDVRYLAGAELLGVVPDASEDPSGLESVHLVVQRFPDSLVAESIRQVRVEALKRMESEKLRSLVIVGAQHESGTTSVAVNLAVSIAQSGRRVVLVDANLRRPALHQVFDAPVSPGVGDLLAGRASVDEVQRATSVDSLSLIPAGQVDHGAFDQLESPILRQVIDELESRYDMIILDSPPAGLLADPRLLADRVDASLLVVRAVREKRGLTNRVIRQLSTVRAQMIGIVLNGVKTQAGGYFRRSYREFYKYHHANAQHRRPVDSKKAGAA